MNSVERRDAILRTARDAGRVEVTALAEEYDVTHETIRRDLAALEDRGLVRRTRGGAIPADRRLGPEPPLIDRQQVLEKDRIALAAVTQLPSQGTVIIDAGTTTEALARAIPADRELTVVTNGLTVALALVAHPKVHTYLVGGRVRGRTMAAVEGWAMDCLRNVSAEVVFLGTNGISAERGLTTPTEVEARVKELMIQNARRKVVLADHTKFRADFFSHFGSLSQIDLVITDDGADDRKVAEVRAAGPEVVLA